MRRTEEKKRLMKKIRTIVIFTLIILGICFFATKERRALYSANKAYTMERYEHFLSKYPESKYKERVFASMYMLAKNNAYDLLEFYKKYPNQPQALKVLEDGVSLAYEDAALKKTEEGWESFFLMLDTLDKYHIWIGWNKTLSEKRTNIIETYREYGREQQIEVIFLLGEEKAWEILQSKKMIAYYEKYLTYYPEGKHKKECNKQLDEMTWEIVQTERTIERCNEYLKSFPKGRYRNKCNKLLIDLEIEEVYSSGEYGKLPPLEQANLNTASLKNGYSVIEVYNDTKYELTLLYGGKIESKRVVFSPQQTKTVQLRNGHYKIVASVNASNITNYVSEETLTGNEYSVTYYIYYGFDYRRSWRSIDY